MRSSRREPPPRACILGFNGADIQECLYGAWMNPLKEVSQSWQEGGVFLPAWKTQMTSVGATLVFCDTNSELPRAVGLNPIILCSTQEA